MADPAVSPHYSEKRSDWRWLRGLRRVRATPTDAENAPPRTVRAACSLRHTCRAALRPATCVGVSERVPSREGRTREEHAEGVACAASMAVDRHRSGGAAGVGGRAWREAGGHRGSSWPAARQGARAATRAAARASRRRGSTGAAAATPVRSMITALLLATVGQPGRRRRRHSARTHARAH